MTDTETICCGYGPSGRAFTVGGLENCCNGKCDYCYFRLILIFFCLQETHIRRGITTVAEECTFFISVSKGAWILIASMKNVQN